MDNVCATAPSTTLASGTRTPARRFQGCHTCSLVAVWKFCVILSWWLSSCRRRSWATTTLHREPDMRRYPDPQHLCWQSFCSCRSRAMELFTATSQRSGLTVQSVPAVTKDIFVWGHGAVWTILTAPSRNNRTYLLRLVALHPLQSVPDRGERRQEAKRSWGR